MKISQLSTPSRRWLWSFWDWGKMQHLSPIDAIKHITQCIIKPRTRPSEAFNALRPDWEQMIGENYGELGSNYNIFNVDAKNDKHERPNSKPYRLPVWKTERFWFRFEK